MTLLMSFFPLLSVLCEYELMPSDSAVQKLVMTNIRLTAS